MLFLLFTGFILTALIWYLGLRATVIYGAYMGGYLAYLIGAHWIMIAISVFLGAVAVYGICFLLSASTDKRPWAGYTLLAIVSGPPFLVGYSFVYQYMRSESQSAGLIESLIASSLLGIMMAAASFSAYQRDLSASLGD